MFKSSKSVSPYFDFFSELSRDSREIKLLYCLGWIATVFSIFQHFTGTPIITSFHNVLAINILQKWSKDSLPDLNGIFSSFALKNKVPTYIKKRAITVLQNSWVRGCFHHEWLGKVLVHIWLRSKYFSIRVEITISFSVYFNDFLILYSIDFYAKYCGKICV